MGMVKKLILVLLIAIMELVPLNCVGQDLVKYKIYCSDVNKRSLTTNKIIVEYGKDVLTVIAYKNKVAITSEKFGKTIQFNNYCRHRLEKTSLSSKFENDPGIQDIFYNSREYFVSYSRTKKARPLQTLLQIQFDNDYYYNFNVGYAKIYDKINDKWVMGHVVSKSYEDDKVRNRLRLDLGILCPDFEFESYETIDLINDPWKQ